MLTKRIIPCLDVADGRVVKGTNFVDLRDAGDPIELAQHYNNEGADEVVFLDITASSDKRQILKDLVHQTAQKLFIPFTVGGGINTVETIQSLLLTGADKVSINTAAIRNPALIADAANQFGSQCIVVAIDAKQVDDHWEIFTHGGRNTTGINAVDWAKHVEKQGAGELLVTSMDKDGTKSGYDVALTSQIANQVSIPVIASGGAGTVQHIIDALNVCDAALLASLLHFQELSIDEIKTHMEGEKIPTRK